MGTTIYPGKNTLAVTLSTKLPIRLMRVVGSSYKALGIAVRSRLNQGQCLEQADAIKIFLSPNLYIETRN